MITLRISITKEVLEATKDCIDELAVENCAIAYAVRQVWPDASVHQEDIYPFGTIEKASIPHSQSDFIDRFDRATPAERAAIPPFDFTIEVPDEVINEVNIEEIREILKVSKTLQLVK